MVRTLLSHSTGRLRYFWARGEGIQFMLLKGHWGFYMEKWLGGKGWSKQTSWEVFPIVIPNRNECFGHKNTCPRTFVHHSKFCSKHFVHNSWKLLAIQVTIHRTDKEIVWFTACGRGSLHFHCCIGFHCANPTVWFVHTVTSYTAMKTSDHTQPHG